MVLSIVLWKKEIILVFIHDGFSFKDYLTLVVLIYFINNLSFLLLKYF